MIESMSDVRRRVYRYLIISNPTDDQIVLVFDSIFFVAFLVYFKSELSETSKKITLKTFCGRRL